MYGIGNKLLPEVKQEGDRILLGIEIPEVAANSGKFLLSLHREFEGEKGAPLESVDRGN